MLDADVLGTVFPRREALQDVCAESRSGIDVLALELRERDIGDQEALGTMREHHAVRVQQLVDVFMVESRWAAGGQSSAPAGSLAPPSLAHPLHQRQAVATAAVSSRDDVSAAAWWRRRRKVTARERRTHSDPARSPSAHARARKYQRAARVERRDAEATAPASAEAEGWFFEPWLTSGRLTDLDELTQ